MIVAILIVIFLLYVGSFFLKMRYGPINKLAIIYVIETLLALTTSIFYIIYTIRNRALLPGHLLETHKLVDKDPRKTSDHFLTIFIWSLYLLSNSLQVFN